MNTLLIDAGNSNIKWSLLDKGQLDKMKSRAYNKVRPISVYQEILTQSLKDFKVSEVVIVSVLGDKFIEEAKEYALSSVDNFINVKSEPRLAGVTNSYNDFSKLGADRFVAMIAAHHLDNSEKKTSTIVVDSGTATTIDAVDMHGQHLGGVILSGLDLCSQSLLENTELLPLFNKERETFEPNIFSSDTTQAISNGSLYGLAGAITHISFLMEKEIMKRDNNAGNINKIITGGAAKKLHPYIDRTFKIHNNLLMMGLKVIAEMEQQPKKHD